MAAYSNKTNYAPTVSAVIASKGRPEGVARLIGDLRRQKYPAEKLEIIVIDDGSETPYRLDDERVRVIRHEVAQGAQKSRNEGLAAATGEIILMLDDDIELVGDDFIRLGVEAFETHPQVAVVIGSKTDVIQTNGTFKTKEFSVSRPTWYSGDLVRHEADRGPIDWGHQIGLIKRSMLAGLGGYDGIYGLNGGHSFREESDVHARLRQRGHLIWYLPDTAIRHHITESGGHGAAVGKRLFWIAHNHIIFLRRHLCFWPWRALGFLFDVGRYSWVQGRFRYIFHMLAGYAAGWRNALRDRGPGKNLWLEKR